MGLGEIAIFVLPEWRPDKVRLWLMGAEVGSDSAGAGGWTGAGLADAGCQDVGSGVQEKWRLKIGKKLHTFMFVPEAREDYSAQPIREGNVGAVIRIEVVVLFGS